MNLFKVGFQYASQSLFRRIIDEIIGEQNKNPSSLNRTDDGGESHETVDRGTSYLIYYP